MTSTVDEAREAFARGDWASAFAALSALAGAGAALDTEPPDGTTAVTQPMTLTTAHR